MPEQWKDMLLENLQTIHRLHWSLRATCPSCFKRQTIFQNQKGLLRRNCCLSQSSKSIVRIALKTIHRNIFWRLPIIGQYRILSSPCIHRYLGIRTWITKTHPSRDRSVSNFQQRKFWPLEIISKWFWTKKVVLADQPVFGRWKSKF